MTKRFPDLGSRSLLRAALPIRSAVLATEPAVADVSFEVAPGEVLGIIGPNGSGKSTLLRLAAGILEPSTGQVEVAGVPASIIELGLSFHRALSGWENLPLAGALYGVEADAYDEFEREVVAFSGIGDLMYLPVKHFSTGMAARLGFAIATHVPSPVLLIDEVLAVGDLTFQMSCIQRVRHLARQGTGVAFVSHSLDLVYQLCDRAICLAEGRIVDEGEPGSVIARYERRAVTRRRADEQGVASIVDLELAQGVVESGASLRVRATVDVGESAVPLRIQSGVKDPASPSGLVNRDQVPIGTFDRPGRWIIEADIGPISTTAGKLEVWLEVLHADETDVCIDHTKRFFTVRGEDLGAVRVAMDASWELLDPPAAIAQDAEPRLARREPNDQDIVQCIGLSKVFPPRRLERGMRDQHAGEVAPVRALDAIDLAISPGESVGIIGPNGSGKSTLLQVLAGVSEASAGRAEVRGRIASVLELGTGFHPQLSGEENLQFSWELHGGDPERWPEAYESIRECADIGAVLGSALKSYSTGMSARLSVALVLELEPDVLIIDEALSVGDLAFRERIRLRLLQLIEGGTTLLFAAHDLDMVRALCDRTVRLDRGRIVADAATEEVLADVGGTGWAGGATGGDGSVLVHGLTVIPSTVAPSQPFEVEFDLDVVRPSPTAYLEFSIRDPLPPEERAAPRSREELLTWTEHLHRIGAATPLLATGGRARLHGRLGGVPLLNTHNIAVSAVDAIGGTLLTEQWRTTFFGSAAEFAGRLEVTWHPVSSPPEPQPDPFGPV